MCGISGWSLKTSVGINPDILAGMNATLRHRGPDDSGFFQNANGTAALSHNRLSIIDLSQLGHQPMTSSQSGNVLAFNGEIYNFRPLRRQLQGLGHVFTSNSDSEVLLKSFDEWGMDCVHHLKGMFAFAIWCPREESLFLARDPMGMKPLYLWTMSDQKGVAFASEVKAFLQLPGFKREVDRKSLVQYLEFGFSCEANTIFENVTKVPPGSWMQLRNGRVEQSTRYFRPGIPERHGSVERKQAVDQLHQTLDQVVSEHLNADVPVGVLLSGGLDSSLIAAIAARHSKIQTFTMGFSESSVDERPFARKVSSFIGSDHHELEISPQEITQNLEENVRYFDDIFADWGMVSTRLLYQKCRQQGIKVVIVGEGADELFGGYGVFKKSLEGELTGPRLWRLFQLYRLYAGRRYGDCFFEFSRLMRGYLDESGDDYFHAIRMFESTNQLPNSYVMKVDKASMAVSVEARVPYLDPRVAELAYRLPRDALISHGSDKILLRQMAARYRLLPDEIINREKFGAPLAISWMDDSPGFRSYARESILSRDGWTDTLGLRRAMEDYFDKKKTGYAFPRSISLFRNLAWRLLLLNLWSKHYLSAAYGN